MVKNAVGWAGGREGLTMDFMDDMDLDSRGLDQWNRCNPWLKMRWVGRLEGEGGPWISWMTWIWIREDWINGIDVIHG
jgi:hypothetical protein